MPRLVRLTQFALLFSTLTLMWQPDGSQTAMANSCDFAKVSTDDEADVGSVTRVTLYRGQALVTRTIALDGKSGSQEIVVGNLPGTVIDTSLYANSTNEIEVRAVRFRQRAVGEEPREEVRKLDEEMARTKMAIALNQKGTELAIQKLAYLDQLQNFVAPSAQTELKNGVLNAETLRELTKFSFEQRTEVAEAQIRLQEELESLNKQHDLLGRSRDQLTLNAQRTVNEAVIFLEKLVNGPQVVELNYLVSNCGWSPNYTIRGADDRDSVQVDYNALIQQMSGEDWSQVQLTLSTASPLLSASGPSLAPFNISLGSKEVAQRGNQQQAPLRQGPSGTSSDASGEGLSTFYNDNRKQQIAANVMFGNAVDFQAKTTANWSLNQYAGVNQQLELSNPIETLSSIMLDANQEASPSLSYTLDAPVSLASRTDQQMVRIFRGSLTSKFYHVATPLVSSYVYREAEVENASDIDFLAGTVTVYIDNRFVGRAEIPTVAQGETFILGFGSDAQLRTRRELIQRQDGVQGGNKEVKLEYRILVENYKKKAVDLRIFDRLPYTNRPSDIRISLENSSPALSTDPLYLKRERTKNILRWDVNVPELTSGEKATEIKYGVTLDYDRNFVINDDSSDQASVEEFQQLERSRQKR